MDILEIILAVISCFLLCIFLFLLMIFSARDSSYKSQEETKETKEMKHVVPDAEYNKLIEQYGREVVLMAELEYNQLILDLNGKENISISFADECALQNEKLKERAKKLKEQEAEIKRIKSLSKEELELYLLQEKAIKQIKSK